MTVHLNLSHVKNNENLQKAKLHYIPCVIKTDGEAAVSTYFEPIISKQNDSSDVLKASFRGHPLLGKEIVLPKNYCGIVLEETNPNSSGNCERNVYGTHTFDKFTYWNWDVEPSNDDKVISAMDWLEIAEALHSPVDG